MTRTNPSVRDAIRLAILIVAASCSTMTSAQTPSGPLRVHPTNPRYFADAQNRAVYLTGSHTWGNMQDMWQGTYTAFNFSAYLDMMQANNHNFVRLWRLELPAYRYNNNSTEYSSPHPWKRTGPGNAGYGGLKFDLTQFEQAYFDRIRARCIAAGNRGMYASVMLFEGHGIANAVEAWYSHPMKSTNNINGINGDPNNDGRGIETHTLDIATVRSIQEAYVRKVIDTVNDLDNVIYEISNESHQGSVAWQNHMVAYVNSYQTGKPQQHLVWFSTTFPGNTGNSELWSSSAQVISPGTAASNGAYRDNPPVNNGSKIIVNDTDHLWGCGGSGSWVWKSFTRGLHPIYMDGYYPGTVGCEPNLDIRKQMGNTRLFALRMNLANAVPSTTLANTGWCLADAGDAYLIYSPNGGNVTINLSGAPGSFHVEWFNPSNGQTSTASNVAGGGSRTLTPPFSGQAVVFVSLPTTNSELGDVNDDGAINVADLLIVIGDWGVCSGCQGDADGNGLVNISDMMIVVNTLGT